MNKKNLIGTDMETVNTGTYQSLHLTHYGTDHDGFDNWLPAIKRKFNAIVNSEQKLFTSDAYGLYGAYLGGIPAEHRQYYTCHECERFINTVGNLVAIDSKGNIKSALWDLDTTPVLFKDSVKEMIFRIEAANITGVFVPDNKRYGVPKTGYWTHFSVDVPANLVHRDKLKTAYQVAANLKEEFGMLVRALYDYPTDVTEKAIELLRSGQLFRAEKAIGNVQWLIGVQEQIAKAKTAKQKRNVIWVAVAEAPTGYAHIRGNAVNVLLDGIRNDETLSTIKAKFAERMDPTKYQRPQTVKAGNLAHAEQLVKKAGIERSLVRRFATIDDLELLWKPKAKKVVAPQTGLFAHLSPKQQEDFSKKNKVVISGVTPITFAKLARTVLPYAEEIEIKVKGGSQNFSALVTAQHEDAPPILQWDNEEQRNPVNWYVYANGSFPSQWNVTAGWNKVTGITYQPSMWYGHYPHQGESVFFLIKGAKDTRYKGAGIALFPETLKAEYREIRSTIEAHSKSQKLLGGDRPYVCGLKLQANSKWDYEVRVTTKSGVQVYKVDRWD